MAFQIEIVLFEPISLLFGTIQGLQIAIFDVSATIAQDDGKTKNERGLSNSVGDGLTQIPSEPANVEDGMVSD